MKDLNLGMFKPYDIRTKIEKLSQENLKRLSEAVAIYYKTILKAPAVVIGRDARLYAPMVVESLCYELRRAGLDVFLNPLPISTCQFYYSCMKHPKFGGIMVTASHNPGSYIGLKLMAPKLFPLADGCGPEGGIAKIREIYLSEESIIEEEKGDKKTIVITFL